MSVEAIIRTEFEQVAREQGRSVAALSDNLVLLDCGLDSLCFSIIVTRLEAQLGVDPFATAQDIWFPVTLGEFIRFYQDAGA